MSNGKSLGETQSLRIHLTDVRVVHLHPLRDDMIVVFTLRYRNGDEYPGSVTLPLSRVQELRLEVGDELTILTQKTKSQFHSRKQ
jgi:hypothetical protein